MTDVLLSPTEVEAQIMRVSAALEEETSNYAEVCEVAARAEADYKLAWSRSLITVANDHRGDRTVTASEREAIADRDASDTFRVWKINDARRAASKEALLSLRARIDALRTLSANLRVQT